MTTPSPDTPPGDTGGEQQFPGSGYVPPPASPEFGDSQFGGTPPAYPPQPGYSPQPGFEPQSGYAPQPGYESQPGYGPQPGFEPQPGYSPQPGYAPSPGYGAQGGYLPQAGYPVAVPEARGNVQLNYWLSVFFTWIPALIYYLIDKDKGDAQLTAYQRANMNFALLRVFVAIFMLIPFLGWIVGGIAAVVLFILHIVAAAKAPGAYERGEEPPFAFNISLIK